MFKKIALPIVIASLLVSCASVPSISKPYSDPRLSAGSSQMKAATSSDPFYINRYVQTETIPAGSSIALIGGGGSGTSFLAAALLEKGLRVREVNLYNLIPMSDLQMTIPNTRFDYQTSLVADASKVVSADAADAATESPTTDIDINALIDRLYSVSDLTVEAQRIDQYISLKAELKSLLESLDVSYIMVVGSSYSEFDYTVSIYRASNLDLIFTHTIVADIEQWRRVVGEPSQSDNISYSFDDESEPVPFFELAYSQFLAGILEVQ